MTTEPREDSLTEQMVRAVNNLNPIRVDRFEGREILTKDLVAARKLLRAPFEGHLVSKLPKATCSKEEYKQLRSSRCPTCGGWHPAEKTIHLDYVGHAAITDRLLAADPEWSWEPMATTDEGLPRFDQSGGLWIRLTVCGVTRLGYGHGMVKSFGDPGNREKEVIGDALRNAAMRFGCGLDLWHKGGPMHDADDHGDDAGHGPDPFPNGRGRPPGAPPKAAAAPKSKGAPKAPPAEKPAAQPQGGSLMVILEAFQNAADEVALLEVGKQVSGLTAQDRKTAAKAYTVRLAELKLRAELLKKIRPALGQALIDFCGEELGIEVRTQSDLDELETMDLETIGKWLGTVATEPEVE